MLEIFLNPDLLTGFLKSSVQLSVPILFAALAGVLCERCGVFNIALEGAILVGAFGSALGAYLTGSAAGGLLLGMSSGVLLGVLLATMAVGLHTNQFVAGIALNILAFGLTAYLAREIFGAEASLLELSGFEPIALPLLSAIPLIGPALFNQDLLFYLAFILVPVSYFFLFRTRWGLIVTATGEEPRAVDAAGISVFSVRFVAVSLACGVASLGGVYLVLSQIFLFTENMSAGKGFIALAAVILGRWSPVGAMFACFLFGFFDSLQLRLQFVNPDIPNQLFAALPYLVAIAAIIGALGKSRMPAMVGYPYDREQR